MAIFKPPTFIPYVLCDKNKYVFLAGSIEMGTAENWQTHAEKRLEEIGMDVLNPRRDDWDSSWEQSIDNPHFYDQVTWELRGLDLAKYIIMYFDPNTKSPISLLELGLHAQSDKLIVICPDGFWRKGNVDIVCECYGIAQADSIDQAIDWIEEDNDNY